MGNGQWVAARWLGCCILVDFAVVDRLQGPRVLLVDRPEDGGLLRAALDWPDEDQPAHTFGAGRCGQRAGIAVGGAEFGHEGGGVDFGLDGLLRTFFGGHVGEDRFQGPVCVPLS